MKKALVFLFVLVFALGTAIAEGADSALSYVSSIGYEYSVYDNPSGITCCNYAIDNSKTATIQWSDADKTYEIEESPEALSQLYVNLLLKYEWDSCTCDIGNKTRLSYNAEVQPGRKSKTYDEYVKLMEFGLGLTGEAAVYRTLEIGSKGDDVVLLQQRLIDLYYLFDNADGDYGKKTKEAVIRFQTEVGLSTTGTADQKTQETLFAEDAPKAKLKVMSGTISFGSRSRTEWSISGIEFSLMGNETKDVKTPWGTFHCDAYGNYEQID